jgi:soluble lytic murein transglycosylase-like protein
MRKPVAVLSLVALFSLGGLPEADVFASVARVRAGFNETRVDAGSGWLAAAGEAFNTLRAARSTAFHPYGAVVQDDRVTSAAIPPQYTSIVATAADAYGVDARLIAAVALHESRWNPVLVSTAGAAGVMQLMPDTAAQLGVADSFDPRQNITGGTRYLRKLLDHYRGNLDLALAAYNAGPTAVARHGGIPPYSETRAYVAAVKATYSALRNAS